jgi:hypothetical protein
MIKNNSSYLSKLITRDANNLKISVSILECIQFFVLGSGASKPSYIHQQEYLQYTTFKWITKMLKDKFKGGVYKLVSHSMINVWHQCENTFL